MLPVAWVRAEVGRIKPELSSCLVGLGTASEVGKGLALADIAGMR